MLTGGAKGVAAVVEAEEEEGVEAQMGAAVGEEVEVCLTSVGTTEDGTAGLTEVGMAAVAVGVGVAAVGVGAAEAGEEASGVGAGEVEADVKPLYVIRPKISPRVFFFFF